MGVLLNNPSGAALLTLFLFYLPVVLFLLYRVTAGKRRSMGIKIRLICFLFILVEVVIDIVNFAVYNALYSVYCYQPRHLFVKILLYGSIFLLFDLHSSGYTGRRYSPLRVVVTGWALFLITELLSLYIFHLSGQLHMVVLSVFFMLIVAVTTGYAGFVILGRYDIFIRCLKRENARYILGFLFFSLFLLFLLFLLLGGEDIPKEWHLLLLFIPILFQILYIGFKENEPNNKKRAKSYGESRDEERFVSLIGELHSDEYGIIRRLVNYFEACKPYLDKNLKIEDVSRHLCTNKTYLSRALNRKMYKNFNQFVNKYRIVEACRIFIENRELSVNQLCDLSGFKNISSFCAAFNLNTGYTPAEWCKEVKRRLESGENVDVESYFV